MHVIQLGKVVSGKGMGCTSYFAQDLASLALTSLMRFCSCLSCSAWYSVFNLQTIELQHALGAFLTQIL